jgi:hypothetical protein
MSYAQVGVLFIEASDKSSVKVFGVHSKNSKKKLIVCLDLTSKVQSINLKKEDRYGKRNSLVMTHADSR